MNLLFGPIFRAFPKVSPHRCVVLLLFLPFLSITFFAQELPKNIRGYKVHREIISINSTAAEDKNAPGLIKFGEPSVADLSITGLTLAIPAEVLSKEQSGKIDFLMFHDVRVNEIPVAVEEYTTKFEFKKNLPFDLPEPARIFLPTTRIVQAAWHEMRDSRKEWVVTGRVFVFGKFRKYGFHHKRAVPVDFRLTFANPLLYK